MLSAKWRQDRHKLAATAARSSNFVLQVVFSILMPRVSHAPSTSSALLAWICISRVAFCARIQLVLLADNVFFKLAAQKGG
jgi:hypothetical protein